MASVNSSLKYTFLAALVGLFILNIVSCVYLNKMWTYGWTYFDYDHISESQRDRIKTVGILVIIFTFLSVFLGAYGK